MKERMETGNTSRIAYLDNLRVFAAFAVVIIHVASQNWYTTDFSSLAWRIFNLYDSAVRWAVPMFVMVSGVVFLNREIPVKQIFTKYILRLATAFFFWSAIYACINGGTPKELLYSLIVGGYHMWYIRMLMGIYLSIPVYKKITESDSLVRYFLGISLFMAILLPNAVSLILDFGPELLKSFVHLTQPHLKQIKSPMMLGYSFYFMLGYYLNRVEIPGKYRRALYFFGVISCFVTAICTGFGSRLAEEPNINYYNEFTLNVVLQAAAVFVFFKYHSPSGHGLSRLCARMSRYCFGIYWVHLPLINLLAEKLNINTLSFFPAISVPVIGIGIFAASFALSWLIGRIPLLKKYVI